MIDYHARLVKTLNTILPTHYEMTLNSKVATPCISYMEVGNSTIFYGDTIGYSRIQYQIKVWGNSIEALQKYAKQIDDALRPIGFTRTSSNELYDANSTMIQKILTYEGIGYEEIGGTE